MNMKMNNEIVNVSEFLDKLSDEYIDAIIEYNKIIIINEEQEEFERCQIVMDKIFELTTNVATTIKDLTGIEYQLTYDKLITQVNHVYTQLKNNQY